MQAAPQLSSADMIDLPKFEAMLDPFPHYVELAAKGPVVHVKIRGNLPAYVITRWEEGQAALRDPRFSKRSVHMHHALEKLSWNGPPPFPISGAKAGNLLNTDPPDHTRLRSLVNLAFSSRRVEALRSRIELMVERLLADLKGREDADLIGEFAYPIGITMICDLLGIPESDRKDFREWATITMTPGHPEQPDRLGKLMTYLAGLIGKRRAEIEPGADPESQPDLLSAMIAARLTNDALTEDETISMAFLMLIAGHETTVGLIGSALFLLMRHPEQLAQLVAQPALLKPTIEETLRHDGPVHLTTMRATSEDVEIGGTSIPKASFVLVLLAGLNRDEERFPDADQFDITKPPGKHMAFGHGIHFCLGSHLARLEAEIAVGRIVNRFPQMRLSLPPEEIPWAGTVIRSASRLPVVLGPASQGST